MTLEIALRPPFTLPRVFRVQNDEPQQEVHWVGEKQNLKQGKTHNGKENIPPPEKKKGQEYRLLSSITLGEVEDVLQTFADQLVPSHENWIAKNHFCRIMLKRKADGRPPVIFGRINSCFPMDGSPGNIEDIEMLFPHKEGVPDLIRIQKGEISRFTQMRTQSYYIRVAFKGMEADAAEFKNSALMFTANGFLLDPVDASYYDLLEINHQNQNAYPRLYVIGSRWFDSIPDSLHMDIRAQLERMLNWGKHIFNYHPDRLSKEVNTLNQILGYKYEFTPIALTEPANPQETAFIVEKKFREAFMKGFRLE